MVNAIRRGLTSQEVVDAFVLQARESFTAHHAHASTQLELLKLRLVRVETKIRNLLDQAESGLGQGACALGEPIREREQDRRALLGQIEELSVEAPPVPDIPDFEAAYQDVINDLRSTLSSPEYVHRAHETIAKPIDRIEVLANPGAPDGWDITIHGNLGLVLQAVSASERGTSLSERLLDLASQLSLVARACLGTFSVGDACLAMGELAVR